MGPIGDNLKPTQPQHEPTRTNMTPQEPLLMAPKSRSGRPSKEFEGTFKKVERAFKEFERAFIKVERAFKKVERAFKKLEAKKPPKRRIQWKTLAGKQI